MKGTITYLDTHVLGYLHIAQLAQCVHTYAY